MPPKFTSWNEWNEYFDEMSEPLTTAREAADLFDEGGFKDFALLIRQRCEAIEQEIENAEPEQELDSDDQD